MNKCTIPAGPHEKIVFLSNTSWYLWNFRAQMAKELIAGGAEVVFAAPRDDYSEKLVNLGRFVHIKLDRKGKNPFAEILSFVRIFAFLKREGNCVLLSWTPKANIYGGLASRILRIPFIPNIAGLGFAFSGSRFLSAVAKSLYSLSLGGASTVFFQNSDDEAELVASGAIDGKAAMLLPGSGVDTERFTVAPFVDRDPFVFLFAGRLIEQKGIVHLIEASRELRASGADFVVNIVGFLDEGSPTSVTAEELERWHDEGIINYLGRTDDMHLEINNAHCVVHPSYYREGRPRILLEAASCGRPAITTDSVGCRDAVVDGVTGIICEPRNSSSLADAMKTVMEMSKAEFDEMSAAARDLAVNKFSESIVFDAYKRVLRSIEIG